MTLRLFLLAAMAISLCGSTFAKRSEAKCSTINSMVKAKFPMLAEFHWVLRALGVRMVPKLNAPRDIYAPSNHLMMQILASRNLSLTLTRKPGWEWTSEQKDSLATLVRKMLIQVPEDGPGSCGKILYITTMEQWDKLRSGKKPKATAKLADPKQKAKAAGAGPAPIYSFNGDYNGDPNVNNNTGMVGTGYNIYNAGPNAWSAGPTGTDPGFTYYPIFSMDNGFTYGLADSGECTTNVNAMYSAQSTAKSTSYSLTGSATYDGVTGGANVNFQNNLNYQTSSKTLTTSYSCPSSYFQFELSNTYAYAPESSAYETLDPTFYSETLAVIGALVTANYDYNAVTSTLGPWMHQYGTHFVTTSYSGAYQNQVCSMSNYAYSYAKDKSFSWGANLNAGTDGVSVGGGTASNTSSQFQSIQATCTTSLTPGSVPVPFVNGEPNTQQWLQNVYSAGRLMPGFYQLQNITTLFDYPNLWAKDYKADEVSQAGAAIQAYIDVCAPGTPDQPSSCPVPSSDCAQQTFFDGNACQSCYTAGPMCSQAGNPQGGAISSCTASTCDCTPPWTGNQCLEFNLGTCYAEKGKRSGKDTRHSCIVYNDCCAPGFQATTGTSGNYCMCQCQNPSGNVNGYTGGGACGTSLGFWCGSGCGKSCTNEQGNGPYTCSSR